MNSSRAVATTIGSVSYETEPVLRFVVEGRLCPNNLVTRSFHGIPTKNPRAATDQARVADLAFVAAKRLRWKIIAKESGYAAAVEVLCWNPHASSDIDGRLKVLFDGMNKIAYEDDKLVKRLTIADDYDSNGPRYEISVSRIPMPVRRPKPRKMRFEDLDNKHLNLIAAEVNTVLDPNPGIVIPLHASAVPAAWKRRAKSAAA